MNKTEVHINGNVRLPLTIGERAVIFRNSGGTTLTTLVAAINQVADGFIEFETEESIYSINNSKKPVHIALAVSVA